MTFTKGEKFTLGCKGRAFRKHATFLRGLARQWPDKTMGSRMTATALELDSFADAMIEEAAT